MGDFADIKELIGKRFMAIQNRHNSITIETDDGQWTAHQSGQARILGKYPIGAQILNVRKTAAIGVETLYELTTSEGDFSIRSQS